MTSNQPSRNRPARRDVSPIPVPSPPPRRLARQQPTPLHRPALAHPALADRPFRPDLHVLLSDGDEGLDRLGENHFPRRLWRLDRRHLGRAVRAFTGPDQAEFRRLMAPRGNADSKEALEALRTGPRRHRRSRESRALFRYLLGNREGIYAWRQVPAALRRGGGRTPPGQGRLRRRVEDPPDRHPPPLQTRRPELASGASRPAVGPPETPRPAPAWNAWWKTKPRFHLKANPP